MLIDYDLRPYRPCVGIVLINQAKQVFVGQRLDNSVEAWQMPQGGIDDGETAVEAGFREMMEEIGTNNAELLVNIPHGLIMTSPSIWRIVFGMVSLKANPKNGWRLIIWGMIRTSISIRLNLSLGHGNGQNQKPCPI